MEFLTEFLKVLFAPGYFAWGLMTVFSVTFTSITLFLVWKENRKAKQFNRIKAD